MNLEQVSKLESKLLVSTYDRYPVLLHKGRGVYLYDNKGRKYLDLLSGIGVNALGYAHPAITRTIARQAKLLVHTSNLFYHEYQGRLAAALTKISGMDRVFFTNSGTEAWEGALKLARAYAQANCVPGEQPKFRILALEHAFHGRTFGAMSTTHKEKYRLPFAPVVPGVEFVLFNDVADLEHKFDSTVCAIGFEFVQGEGGIRPVSAEFAETAYKLARKHNALLIADEIQSGMGRTGKWFAYQHYGIQPDLVTVAKPIAGGLPLGALLATEKVSGCIHPGMHGTTFGGGPLACAVALQLVTILEKEKMLKHIQKTGGYLMEQLHKLQKKHSSIVEVRGQGLMIGVELESADLAKQVFQQLLKLGTIVNRTDETVIRLLPPFIIKKQHIDTAVSQLNQVLAKHRSSCHNREEQITMMPARMYDLTAMRAPVEQPVICRDLVSTQDFSPEETKSLFELAHIIKHRPADFRGALAGKQLVLFFEKPSLRTRLTFEAGMASLGGTSLFMDQTNSLLGEREPVCDIARNVERWVDAVVLRTFSHKTITEMARHTCIPVINALSDVEHPCQAFADFFTLEEKFGDLSKVHMAYVGDGNNVAHSLMLAAAALGTSLSVATPEGYEPSPEITETAKRIGRTTGAFIEITNDAVKAVTGANAIYTDVWASMGQEDEAAERAKIFAPYQVNDQLFFHAAPHALFMHCLPAHRGEEVTASVIDSPRSIVFDQAENRMHIQKAILLLLLGSGMRTAPTRSNHA